MFIALLKLKVTLICMTIKVVLLVATLLFTKQVYGFAYSSRIMLRKPIMLIRSTCIVTEDNMVTIKGNDEENIIFRDFIESHDDEINDDADKK